MNASSTSSFVRRCCLVSGILACLGLATVLHAQISDVTFSGGWVSSDFSKGRESYDGTSATVGSVAGEIGAWSWLVENVSGLENDGSEWVVSLAETVGVGGVSAELSYNFVHDHYEGESAIDHEIGALLSTPLADGLTVWVEGFYAFEIGGGMWKTGVDYQLPSWAGMEVCLSAAVGWDAGYVVSDYHGVNHAEVTLTCATPINSRWGLECFAGGVHALKGMKRDGAGDSFLFGGALIAQF